MQIGGAYMDKQIIRKHMKQVLKDIPRKVREVETDMIMQQLLAFVKKKQYVNIGWYFGEFPEIQTPTYYDQFEEIGCHIYIPRTEHDRQMTFREFHIEKIERSSFGVIQPTVLAPAVDPEKLDLLIVPGLAFNKRGFRVGFGGGFYDRFLEKHPEIPTCSLIFTKQIINNMDDLIEKHDKSVGTLILKDKIIGTGGKLFE